MAMLDGRIEHDQAMHGWVAYVVYAVNAGKKARLKPRDFMPSRYVDQEVGSMKEALSAMGFAGRSHTTATEGQDEDYGGNGNRASGDR